MKKSTLLMVLSLVLALTIGLGTTLAYLTDTDADVNVMTLGNVDIEQIEQEWNEDGELVDFTQGKPLYPGVYSEEDEGKDHRFPLTYLKDDEGNDMPEWQVIDGTKSKNAVDKVVTVKNTGKSDAYVRTVFAFEMDQEMTADPYLHIIINNNKVDKDITWTWLQETVEIDGTYYQIGVATYKNALAPGEVSDPSLKQIGLMHTATNEICALFGETYDILVVSQAVQAAGFEDAETALNEAFGEITAENNPWKKDGQDIDGTPLFPVNASDAEDVMEALEAGADVIAEKDLDGEMIFISEDAITLDAKGATVQLNGSDKVLNETTGGIAYSYLGFVPPKGEPAVIENLNVTGTGFVEVGDYEAYRVNNKNYYEGNYIINNLTIKDLTATYHQPMGNPAVMVAPAFGHYGKTAEMNDCVITGTKSLVEGYTPFDVSFPNATSTVINRGEYGSLHLSNQAKVTINDAEVGEITSGAITASNLGMLKIGPGTHVGTITLVPGSYDPAIVIEEGATVDQIIYNGTTYTQAEWMELHP